MHTRWKIEPLRGGTHEVDNKSDLSEVEHKRWKIEPLRGGTHEVDNRTYQRWNTRGGKSNLSEVENRASQRWNKRGGKSNLSKKEAYLNRDWPAHGEQLDSIFVAVLRRRGWPGDGVGQLGAGRHSPVFLQDRVIEQVPGRGRLCSQRRQLRRGARLSARQHMWCLVENTATQKEQSIKIRAKSALKFHPCSKKRW